MRLRMKEELKGKKSLPEPEGRNDKAKPEEWSPETAELEGQGSPVELVG